MEGEGSTRGLGRSCPQALPPAPGWCSSDQADVAAICQDTLARRALPRTGPSSDHKFTAASMVNRRSGRGVSELVCSCQPGPVCHKPHWRVPSDGVRVPWPHLPGPGCHNPGRPGLPHRACGPQAPPPGPGCPCARAAGAAPDPGRVLVIVDRYCPRAGSSDPRSCLTGLVPCGFAVRGRWAGSGSNASHENHTFSVASMVRRQPELALPSIGACVPRAPNGGHRAPQSVCSSVCRLCGPVI